MMMKRLINVLMVLMVGILYANLAYADDAADVKAAVLAVDAAYSSGDVETIFKYMHPEHSRFAADGGLLNPAMFTREGLKTFFEKNNLNVRARHIVVKIYGNTGVVTCYTLITTTRTDGNITRATDRSTEIWVKQDGNWKRVHIHSSLLTPVQQ
jgi:ketosteroid isomerase-like protein